MSNVAQTWAPASNGKKDECTAVQTSEKRIPKQLTRSGGRSPERTLLNVGRRALALVCHTTKNDSATERKTKTKKNKNPTHASIKIPPANIRQIECLNAEKTKQKYNVIVSNKPTGRIHLKIIVNIESWPPALMVEFCNRLLNSS